MDRGEVKPRLLVLNLLTLRNFVDNSKNLGKYLHKAKPKPEEVKINTKIVPNKTPSKTPSTGSNGVRG